MYIIKNALKSISRSKGRNLLIGIIVLVISTATCIGLSIQNAAKKAREATLDGITITAQISVDRNSMMSNVMGNMESGDGSMPSFDKDSFASMMGDLEGLTIEEMEKYAELDTVKSFYYTTSVSMNGGVIEYADGSDSVTLEPVSTNGSGMSDMEGEGSDDTSGEISSLDGSDSADNPMGDMGDMNMGDMPDMGGDKGGFQMGTMGTQGDFTLVGYSSDEAMTDFLNGTCTITDGTVFEEGTAEYQCIITDELATYNGISVGDYITVANPNNEDETYELEVVGIYNNAQSTVSTGGMMMGFSTSSDSANQIYMSYTALNAIVEASAEASEDTTDEETGITTTTALPSQEDGTYVFATVEDYEAFCEDVYEAGLSESYTVSSSDVSQYESSLLPLENLSEMAMYFLIVVFVIGGVVLVVLNIFNVRERKYEVGVLTAIGMKKSKVSMQFILETLMVTIVFVVLGGCIGAATSVPVTNSLLASQIEATESSAASDAEAFGRDTSFDRGGMQMGGMQMGGMQDMGGISGDSMPDMSDMGGSSSSASVPDKIVSNVNNYVDEVTSATDIGVLLQLLGIGVLLALVASAASVVFITRYDPLKILANRD